MHGYYKIYPICSSARKYPYLPREGIFLKTPDPHWKFLLSFIHFFIILILQNPLPPQEIPIPPVGGKYGYFLEMHSIIVLLEV